MKTAIRDTFGRIVCFVDPYTGDVESKYSKHTVRVTLPVGKSITIEREGSTTTIVRLSSTDLQIIT